MKHRIVQALAGLLVLSFVCRATAEDALPSGYTRLGWIQATGLFTNAYQWIITDYTPNPSDGDRIEVRFNARTLSMTQVIFASRGSTLEADNYSCLLADGHKIRYDFGCWTNKSGQATYGDLTLSSRSDYALRSLSIGSGGRQRFYLNNDTDRTLNSDYVGQPKAPIALFAAFYSDDQGHYDTTTASGAGTIRICHFAVYSKQGVLKRNFVPARDDNQSDLVKRYGLYETVQGKFFPNEGTQPFVVPAGVELPEGYTALEYVKPVAKMNATTREALGGAYVDTCYTPKANSLIQCGYTVSSDTFTRFNTIFGVRGENLPETAAMTWQVTYEDPANLVNPVYKVASAGAYSKSPRKEVTQAWNAEVGLSFQGATAQYDGRVLTATNQTDAATAPNGTLYLGAAHKVDATGANVGCADYGTAMIFFFRVFEDGELKVNLLPCRNASDEVGFYDTIRKSFHPVVTADGGSVEAGETGITLKSGADATGADVVLALPRTGTGVTLPGATYTRDGFVQVGWSTSADGSTLDNNFWVEVSAEQAKTLYPAWEPNGAPCYVESDGTQVIDLGFPLTQDMEIELVMASREYLSAYRSTIGYFGARAQNFADDGQAIEVFRGLSDMAQVFQCDFVQTDYKQGGRLSTGFSNDLYGKRLTFGLSAKQVSCLAEGSGSGPATTTPPATTDFQTPTNAWLFGVNMFPAPAVPWLFATARFYSLTITQGGVVTHRFLPAVENDVVGIRDRVGNGGFRAPLTGEGFAPNPLKFGPGDPTAPSASLAPVPPVVVGTGMRRVDAIVSDGSQDIDLGRPLQSGWTIELDFELVELLTSGSVMLFGSRETTYTEKNISIVYDGKAVCFDYQSAEKGGSRMTYSSPAVNLRHTAVLSPEKRELRTATGLVLCENKISAKPGWSTPTNARLFNSDGLTTATNAMLRVYRLRITDSSGSGILDYIPCVTSEGRVGFYDAVSGLFVQQTKGNDFTYGKVLDTVEDAAALRAETTLSVNDFGASNAPVTAKAEVRSVFVQKSGAFVQSDGTQFIDLGFQLKSNMKIVLEFEPIDSGVNKDGTVSAAGIFGARKAAGEKNISLFFGNKGGIGHVVAPDFNNGNYNEYRNFPNEPYEQGARYRVELSAKTRRVYKNGTDITSGTVKSWSGEFATDRNAHLFDVTDTGWDKAKIRFYSLIIETNGVEMCHFVPAVRDGHVGIEDTAGDKGFLYPKNSGATPLVYNAGEFSGQHEFTEEVMVTTPGEVSFKTAPLKPGTSYTYTYSAENGVSEPVTFKGVFATPLEAYPASYSPLNYAFPEKNPRPGTLTVILSRPASGAADPITAVYGSVYGGADLTKWQHSAVIGQFASGETTATLTLALPKDTVYLRFYTAAGGWTETVFIPETKFVPGKQGLAIIVR